MFVIFLILTSSAVLGTTAHTLYITPDDNHSDSNNTHTLSYYLNNTNKYFTSNTWLHFLPGYYILHEDFIIEDVINITIIGNHCTIKCDDSLVGIVMINVVNIVIQNVEIIDCRKNYKYAFPNSEYFRRERYFNQPTLQWKAAMHLLHCASLNVTNVSITVEIRTDGLLVINPSMRSLLYHISIFVTALQSQFSSTNGIVVYNFFQTNSSRLHIKKFTYKQQFCFNNGIENVFHIVFLYNKYISVLISDTVIKNLCNARALYYYYDLMDELHKLYFYNCQVYNNIASGFQYLPMFLFVLGPGPCYSNSYSSLHIYKCAFYKNVNMSSIVHVENASPDCTLSLSITNCSFNHNHMPCIITQNSKLRVNLGKPLYLSTRNTIIASNTHSEGNSLISLHNGKLKFSKITITNNTYYTNIVELSLSRMNIDNYLNISNNCARNVLTIVETSYIIMSDHSTFIAAKNTVHSVLAWERRCNKQEKPLCHFQVSRTYLSVHIEILQNMCTVPMQLLDYEVYFKSCNLIYADDWIVTNSRDIFTKIVNITNIKINKKDIGIIPSSICKCTNSTNYECNSHELGETFPGQTLVINLTVPRVLSSRNSVTLTVETAHLPANGCIITRATEMVQMHTNIDCNQYNYTVWSDKSDCELYLSAEGIAEIFYVKLLPCPVGFSLQYHVRGCHCDRVLDCDVISVTTCNLADGTILRPANSWISADTVNGSHRYHVSSRCPLDYCLPYSSYLNLSTPDKQCQFNRSGVLCGHCQQGLSAVFGSSQCKICSNIHLFIILPIAISGIVLVMMLFALKLTVTNGTVNTFIFYVNIINTSHSTLLPNCHSPICVLLFIFNLDLGIETCFYSNMTNYFKMCLQLAFPLYLIMIALALIIGSRYSSKVQRLTARRGLHVLATLFLLSYTKILSMVCHVLFFYTQTTHFPSSHTQLFWSVDTSVELFGVKFTILFVICLLNFSILILFNTLLLFARFLLRFKVVSNFKPLLDPYFSSYKDRFLYWSGLQLSMRAVFFSLSAVNNQISLFGGIVMAGILLCVQSMVQPFKNLFNNLQESLVLLNLLLVYVAALHNYYNNVNTALAEYLILVVLVYFILFMMYTCLTTLCGSTIQHLRDVTSYYLKAWKVVKKSQSVSFDLSIQNEIPDKTFNYKELREPLVALND